MKCNYVPFTWPNLDLSLLFVVFMGCNFCMAFVG